VKSTIGPILAGRLGGSSVTGGGLAGARLTLILMSLTPVLTHPCPVSALKQPAENKVVSVDYFLC